jgi:hypothetical protein
MKKLTKKEIEEIRKDPDYQDWLDIVEHYELTEEFMEEFRYYLDWDWVPLHQKTTKDFLDKYEEEVDWPFIFSYQYLSEEFLITFIDKVKAEYLEYNQKIPKEVKDRVIAMKALM